MFRRLEAFFDTSANIHDALGYVDDINSLNPALQNSIISGSDSLNGLYASIKSTESNTNSIQETDISDRSVISDPKKNPNSEIYKKYIECKTKSIDELINTKTDNSIGCGWMYAQGDISKGYIGDEKGPLTGFPDKPSYKKWFFDLQEAKRTILLDKCNALGACKNLFKDKFKECGYCPNTGKGIPIDSNGNPLYEKTCNSIPIKSADGCPVPPTVTIPTICTPNDKRLSAACLRDQLIKNGCNSEGSLALALLDPSTDNYIGKINKIHDIGPSLDIYQRTTDLNIFKNGNTDLTSVLNSIDTLVDNTELPKNTEFRAASRDLCLRRGAIAEYDPCSELDDNSQPPYNIKCMQQLFLNIDGVPYGTLHGTLYPSYNDINIDNIKYNIMQIYNSKKTIKEVKNFIKDLKAYTKHKDYKTNRTAANYLYGTPI